VTSSLSALDSLSLLKRILPTLFWLMAAIAVGVVITSQPPGAVIIILVVTTLGVLAFVSPVAAAITLLILAPLRTLIATEARLQLPLDIGQFWLLIFVFVWVAYWVAHGHQIVESFRSPITAVILIYIIVIGFTAFGAVSVGAWLNEWLKWLQILILIAFVLNFAWERRWEWLLFGLTISAAANALVGIYEFFGGSGALHLVIDGRFFRAFGTFGQPNPFGGFMGLIIPLTLMAAVGYAWRAYDQWCVLCRKSLICSSLFLSCFYVLASVIVLIGMVMSWSRGAWVGLLGALLVVSLVLPRRVWRGIVLFGGICGLAILLWSIGLVPRSILERLNTSTQEFFAFEDVRGIDITPENYAVVERLAHWQAAINMAASSPWLGVGLGNYEVAYPVYRLINWQEPLGHAHNYYLNLFAESGVIGLLVYGKVWVIIIVVSWWARRHPDRVVRFVVIGLMGSWTYLSIHSLFDNLYVNNLFLHIGLMFGILAVLYNQSRTHITLGIS